MSKISDRKKSFKTKRSSLLLSVAMNKSDKI
jgi:hypothetical protein